MLLSCSLIFIGFVLLAVGAHYLVRGATALALWLRVTPAVIGITIVALGTSLPEFFVSWAANVKGISDLAVGNVLGSNLLNIALVLGLSGLIFPIQIDRSSIRIEWPAMMAVALLFTALGWDRQIGAGEGLLLFGSMGASMALFIYLGLKGKTSSIKLETAEVSELKEKIFGPNKSRTMTVYAIELLAGFFLLRYGSDVFIKGAVGLSTALGLSKRVIGLTIAALGTSLPELAVSLMATFKGRSDVAIGNILGSNIFNIGGVLGACAIYRPIVFSAAAITKDVPWLLGLGVLLFFCMIKKHKIDRGRGILLLLAYGIYLTQIV